MNINNFDNQYDKICNEQKEYSKRQVSDNVLYELLSQANQMKGFNGQTQETTMTAMTDMVPVQQTNPNEFKQFMQVSSKQGGQQFFNQQVKKVYTKVKKVTRRYPVFRQTTRKTFSSNLPGSNDFLNVDSIPPQFMQGYDKVAEMLKKYLTSDPNGKKLAASFHLDPTNDDQLKAFYGRYNMLKWQKKMAESGSSMMPKMKTVERKIQRQYHIVTGNDKKSDNDPKEKMQKSLDRIKKLLADKDDGNYQIVL